MEETIIDKTQVNEEFCASQVNQSNKGRFAATMGGVAAGYVAGAATTFGAQAVAAKMNEKAEVETDNDAEANAVATDGDETPVTENNVANTDMEASTDTADAPVVESATAIHTAPVAHVSDDMSFAQAFASARHQVGAGGVFTWHGKVYGTYYKEEWDNMTADEKAEYQASVDYGHANEDHRIHHHETTSHDSLAANDTVDSQETQETQGTQTDSQEVEVHVISVEQNVDMNGHDVDVAVIEVDGHHGILVDVDHDGVVEGAIVDFNNDGEIQENEISPDLSGEQIQMPQMSDGDMYMVQNDDMPDYTNDAIV